MIDKEWQFLFQPVTHNNHALRPTAHALQRSQHTCLRPLVFFKESALQPLGLNQTVTFSSPKLGCHFEGTVKLTDL